MNTVSGRTPGPSSSGFWEARRSLAAMEMFSVCLPSRRRNTWFPCGARLPSNHASRVSRRTIRGLLLGAAKSAMRRPATSSQTRAGRKSSRSEQAGVTPTCFVGPRLVPYGQEKAADLKDRSALPFLHLRLPRATQQPVRIKRGSKASAPQRSHRVRAGRPRPC